MKIVTAPPSPRVTCVVCEELLPTAEDGAPLCVRCGHDPAAARRRILVRLEGARAVPHAAWVALNRAVDALTPEEVERWGRMRAALESALGGTAPMDVRARVRETQAAIDRGACPPALAAAWVAYESNWWAGEEGAALAERAQRQLSRLDAWLAATEKEPAHAAD